jgi:hypothetical protein
MTESKPPQVSSAVTACTMLEASPFIVPTATPNGCKGRDFDEYWTDHNAKHNPTVPLRVYVDASSTKYDPYSAVKDANRSFVEYHKQTPAGADVRLAPGGPWVGIILDSGI